MDFELIYEDWAGAISETAAQRNCPRILSDAMSSMVKADIIRSIELKLDFPHQEASLLVEQIINIIKDKLTGGDTVLISGFGQRKVREKNSRAGRNQKLWR